jgi:hypothetical protein
MSASLPLRRTAAPARPRFGQLVGQVQRRQHGDALARLDLAGIADGGHFLVDGHGRRVQQRFAAFGAAQDVAWPRMVTSTCFMAAPPGASAGRRSSSASMRARAAARRERRLSRSAVTAMQLLLDQALVRLSSWCRSTRRSTRSARSSSLAMGTGLPRRHCRQAPVAAHAALHQQQVRTAQALQRGARAWQT